MCVRRIARLRGALLTCPTAVWTPSGSGLETARHPDGGLLVRASGDDGGPVLHYTRAEVEAFVLGVRDGEFDDLTGPA